MVNGSPVIVGLGNPGNKYDGTRHNIGYAVVDFLLQCSGLAQIEDIKTLSASVAERALSGALDYQGWTDQGTYMVASVRISTVSGFLIDSYYVDP
jgi:peptidyl-tRNA hydrolase